MKIFFLQATEYLLLCIAATSNMAVMMCKIYLIRLFIDFIKAFLSLEYCIVYNYIYHKFNTNKLLPVTQNILIYKHIFQN